MRYVLLSAAALAALATGAHALVQSGPAAPVVAAAPVRSGSFTLDKSHAKINWATSHLGFSTYSGEFTDFDAQLTLDGADPANSRLDVTIAIASVETNNDALDTHLRAPDFFDAANHPTATFVSSAVRRTGATTAEVTGNFTLRGVTRPLTLSVTLNRAADNARGVYTVGFNATGVVRRSDYGVSYGLPAVGDEVQLSISGEFNAV